MASAGPLVQAPVLEGERTRLRPIQANDHECVHRLMTNPVVVQGISGQVPTCEETWQKTVLIAGNWSLLGFGSWIVTNKHTQELLGIAGLFDAHRELEPKMSITPEAGWSFFPSVHGKGFARESMQLALDWFDRHHPSFEWTYAMIRTNNESSHRLAQRLGYVELRQAKYKEAEVGLWRRPKANLPGS